MSSARAARHGAIALVLVGSTTLVLGVAAVAAFGRADPDAAGAGVALAVTGSRLAPGDRPGTRALTLDLQVRNEATTPFTGTLGVPGAAGSAADRALRVPPGRVLDVSVTTTVACGDQATATLTGPSGLERRVEADSGCTAAGDGGAGR